ncbi:histidine kinase [Paraflavitalea soli]|uniref:Histidine kinase n=1 Tax=Paraflavitalea soli TaxID=2315862 RepID=A0A3B7MXV4_9BACT|nr:sensor histidine kinase [Paraflavitalea soli]AXY77876.1 histidine kinase [Paraflavitalea soli]
MFEGTKNWSYYKKVKVVELLYFFILFVIVPFSMGVQIFDRFSFTLSLIFLELLQAPSILFFYRWLLPRTLFNNRPWWFLGSLPFYVLVYEINIRLAYLLMINLSFIPEKYRSNLASVEPWHWDGRLVQNMGYTVLILLTSIGFLFIRELFKRQHMVDQLQSDKLRLELDQLKSQIQPHFFFNTLNNLYALSLQGSPKTSVSIANLSGIMRYVLYEAREEKVLLAKEIAFMHSYLELERIRHNDDNVIQFGVQGNPHGILVEPLLFLPLIENCFKHSLHYKIPGNQVQVFMTLDEDEITFQTSNLIAPQTEAVPREGGIGLYNVRKRLELLYPGRHQLLAAAEESRFIVTLSVQLNPPK